MYNQAATIEPSSKALVCSEMNVNGSRYRRLPNAVNVTVFIVSLYRHVPGLEQENKQKVDFKNTPSSTHISANPFISDQNSITESSRL